MSERSVELQRVCLAMVLAAGFAVVFGLAVIWLNEVRRGLVGQESGRHESLVLTGDGEPVITTQWHDGRTWFYEFRTLDGTPVPAVDQNSIQRAGVLGVDDWDSITEYRTREASLIGSLGEEHWYLLVDRRGSQIRAYFAGYDGRTGRSVGYLARDGFRETRPGEAEMLGMNRRMDVHLATRYQVGPGNMSQTLPRYLLADGQFLEFGTDLRSLSPALDRSDFEDMAVLYDSAGQNVPDAGNRHGFDIQLRTRESVVMFDPDEQTAVEYPLPEELHNSLLQFFPLADGGAVVAVWEGEFPWTEARQTYVIDANGAIVKQGASAVGAGVVAFPDDEGVVAAACAFPMPLTWIALGAHAKEVGAAPGTLWASVIITLIAGVAAAWMIAQDAGRRARGRWMWVAFGFIFGLPGYAGYRLHRRRPQPLPPPPVVRGVEVFA